MKLRIALFSVLLTVGTKAFSQHRECKECLAWNENQKLTWNDFKGNPVKTSRNEAMTDSGMTIGLECDGSNTKVEVKSFFNPTKSWTKDKESAWLLAHEQLHFDITELFVRKLRQRLARFGTDCQELNRHIEAFYNENYREFVAYQERYDRETKHSTDEEAQKRWQLKVAQELALLREFAL